MAIVYLNGDFLPEEQACVSVLDRGFIFGDGVYEVIPVYSGHLFRFDQHLERLNNSLQAIRLAAPHSNAEFGAVLNELVQRNGGGDLSLYLQVTRGAATRDHGFPDATSPTVFAMCSPMKPVPAAILADGVAAITVPDIRWQYCHIKAITLLPNILLRQQAVDSGAAEAILIRAGQVTEGSASNVFIVEGDTLVTPPATDMLLPGITRDLILELAAENGIPAEEKPIPESALRQADEIWLTSSTREILAVTQLDGRAVGSGRPGPLWQQMYAIYTRYRNHLRGASTGGAN